MDEVMTVNFDLSFGGNTDAKIDFRLKSPALRDRK
jgi:hypothetical protein